MPGTCILNPLRCSGERGKRQRYKNTRRDVGELLNSAQWPNLLKKRNSGKLSETQPELLPALQPLPAHSAVFRHLDAQKPSTRIAWLPARAEQEELSTFPVRTIRTLHPYLGWLLHSCCLKLVGFNTSECSFKIGIF